jgi:hypothetical protein
VIVAPRTGRDQPFATDRRPPGTSPVTTDRHQLPAPGLAEVRITAASPDVARQIAQVLRARFGGSEQRSYPAAHDGGGTRLSLTVDTTRAPGPAAPFQPWVSYADRDARQATPGRRTPHGPVTPGRHAEDHLS